LTGFGGGLDRKRWLLAHEARASYALNYTCNPIDMGNSMAALTVSTDSRIISALTRCSF
jgi:hypothetical protein